MERRSKRTESRSAATWGVLLLAVCSTMLIWRVTAWELLVIQVAFLLIGVSAIWLEKWKTIPPAVAFVAFCPLWGGLQLALGLSVVRTETMRSIVEWCAVLSAILIASSIAETEEGRGDLPEYMAAFAVILCALAMLNFFTSDSKLFWRWPASELQVMAPFRSRNNFASFGVLMIPLVLWKGIEKPQAAWFWLGGGSIMIAAVVASGSRAGAVLMLAELLVFGFLSSRKKRNWATIAGALAMILTSVAIAGWAQLGSKMSDADPWRYRRETISAAVEMWKERPIWGFGLGTFPDAYVSHAQFDSGYRVNHAHNDWAEWASEGGIPLILCLAAFTLSVGRSSLGHPWGIGFLFFSLHGLVDYPFQRFGLSVWAWMLASCVLQAARCKQESTTERHRQSGAHHRDRRGVQAAVSAAVFGEAVPRASPCCIQMPP